MKYKYFTYAYKEGIAKIYDFISSCRELLVSFISAEKKCVTLHDLPYFHRYEYTLLSIVAVVDHLRRLISNIIDCRLSVATK